MFRGQRFAAGLYIITLKERFHYIHDIYLIDSLHKKKLKYISIFILRLLSISTITKKS